MFEKRFPKMQYLNQKLKQLKIKIVFSSPASVYVNIIIHSICYIMENTLIFPILLLPLFTANFLYYINIPWNLNTSNYQTPEESQIL